MFKFIYKLILKILFNKIKKNKSVQTDFNKEIVEKLEIIIKCDVSTQTTLNYNDFILDDDNDFYHLIWTKNNNIKIEDNLLD